MNGKELLWSVNQLEEYATDACPGGFARCDTSITCSDTTVQFFKRKRIADGLANHSSLVEMLRYDCHVHGGDSIRSTCITNFEQMDQDCQGHQKGRGREEGGKARRKKERKNNGHWFRPARPESRCPKGYQPGQAIQIKRVQSKDEYS